MKRIIVLFLVTCLCLLNLTSCFFSGELSLFERLYTAFVEPEMVYYRGSNWGHWEEDIMSTVYMPLYMSKVDELISEKELDCETLVTSLNDDPRSHVIYIYNHEFTIQLSFYDYSSGGFAQYSGTLYYYGDENGFGDYEDFKPMLDFLNDFTNYAAYDARVAQNQFERLYNVCIDEGYTAKVYRLHADSLVGAVHYKVILADEQGYYYMAQHDNTVVKNCYTFRFQGLLKPLI